VIKLDNRIGSGDLGHYFDKWQVPFQLCRLDYGDCAIKGNGPNGSTMEVGVEIKKIRDALNSICDGRFAGHQLPGLIENYNRIWLVVEGQFSCDYSSGLLMYRRGKKMEPLSVGTRQFMFRDVDAWLTTMEVKGGVHVRRTLSRLETARFIADLHHWFTSKTYEEHRSHLAFNEPDFDTEILFKPNGVQSMAKELPGVGWTKSKAVAKHFKCPGEMLAADEIEWASIEGIGKLTAKKIVDYIWLPKR
jgi:ERCC4-type nuclease